MLDSQIKSLMQNQQTQEALDILQEEAAEVIQAVSKIRRFGWENHHPDETQTNLEHLEEELNALHKEKLKNEQMAKKEFEERIRETKKKAIAENIEKAKANNNVLTQTIDEEGNLIGVKETVDFESREVADAESTKLHNEMIIENAMKKNDDEDSLEKVD